MLTYATDHCPRQLDFRSPNDNFAVSSRTLGNLAFRAVGLKGFKALRFVGFMLFGVYIASHTGLTRNILGLCVSRGVKVSHVGALGSTLHRRVCQSLRLRHSHMVEGFRVLSVGIVCHE